jgi:4-amino-4-deoxy-L-arabinose transferase-like glycosyltransferase
MKKYKPLLIVLIAIGLVLPTLLPLLNPIFFHMHDFTHVARLTEMHEALMDGHFPVRWSRNLGYGYGLPQFNFYAPLPYYIAEGFHLLGFNELNSIKLLIAFNYFASFLAMYYLTQKLWGRWAGLLAATAFIYIPYRAVDTYVRGALGELTAITMLAITLMVLIYLFFEKDWKWVGFGGLALGALVLSHNLVALISFPFIITLCALLTLLSSKHEQRKMAIKNAVLVILGIGLSSFYAIPALTEKKYTMVDQLTQGFSDFRLHFLYVRQFFVGDWGYGGSIAGLHDNISFQIGFIQVMLAILSGLAIMIHFKKVRKIDIAMLLYGSLGIGMAMFLSIYKSQQVWELLAPLMSFIQFPWRFLSVIIVLISILSGAALLVFPKTKTTYLAGFTLITILLLITFNLKYFKPEEYLTNNNDLYYTDAKVIQARMSGIIPDFIPRHTGEKELIPPEARFEVNNSDTMLNVDVDRVHEFALILTPTKDDVLKVNIFDFPGWQLYIDGVKTEHQTDQETGLMSLNIQPNNGKEVVVSGVFEEQGLRLVVDLISLASFMAIMYLILPQHIFAKEQHGLN